MNAKTEILETLKQIGKTQDDIKVMKCQYGEDYLDANSRKYNIHSIDELDFNYDAGYGSQQLDGLVLFNDNTWLERHEHDGSEWWEHKRCPTVDEVLSFTTGDLIK